MNVSGTRNEKQSVQKYDFFYAPAGLAKRNIHLALRKPPSNDNKERFDALSKLTGVFDGELADIALPSIKLADFLRSRI
jgi:hypothetical protein